MTPVENDSADESFDAAQQRRYIAMQKLEIASRASKIAECEAALQSARRDYDIEKIRLDAMNASLDEILKSEGEF